MKLFLTSLPFFLVISFAVFNFGFVSQIDLFFYELFSGMISKRWLLLNGWITFWGEWWTLMGLAGGVGLISLLRRHFLRGVFYFVWMAMGLEINALLKNIFERARPESFDVSIVLASYAYPSGHAFGILVFCLMTCYLLDQMKVMAGRKLITGVAIILVFLVSLSRLALGVHWFSDIVGGLLFGLVWASLFKFLNEKWLPSNS